MRRRRTPPEAEAAPALACGCGVVRRDGRFEALTAEPWLTVALHRALRPGRFVEIVYRLGAWDEPVRPVFRFVGPEGMLAEAIGAGPVAGAAHWIGRVPAGTLRLDVSPTCRTGPFDFVIEAMHRRSLAGLLWRGLRQAPRPTLSAILTRLIGLTPESDNNLCWAIGFTPLIGWLRWRAIHTRPLDLAGIDRPRADWNAGARFRIVCAGPDACQATTESIAAQIYPRRHINVVQAQEAAVSPLPPGDFLLALNARTRLLPEALATIAETAARYPEARLIYADEETVDAAGRVQPAFQPGWNATLFHGRPNLGRAVFARGDIWANFSAAEQAAFIADGRLPAVLPVGLAPDAVRAVPRILLTGTVRTPVRLNPMTPPLPVAARATIVIPTRDQPAHLARCVARLRASAAANATKAGIVIVDNGSVARATADLLQVLAGAPDVTVLKRPGAFDFAALCNDAAAASGDEVLVFLNDDTAVLTPGWLDRLAAQALQPDVGAVGAKLLYPDGRVQHAGIVLGLGGHAGHFGAGLPGAAPGWAERHHGLNDVAAVTGACLAVERRKFMAVGGFDARHFPVELNDVDLCLRLAARGWRARVDPQVEMLHAESASRGRATFRRAHVYAAERARFAARWQHAMRDDPYFHPGLSLFHLAPALGG